MMIKKFGALLQMCIRDRILRWIFKTAISVWMISNTFDIIMAVFDPVSYTHLKGKVAEAYKSLAKEVLADADRQRKLSSERAR